MPSEDRLSLIAPELSQRLQTAPVSAQRAAAMAACTFAMSRNGLIHPALQYAIHALQEGQYGESRVSELVAGLLARLDNEYFDLQEVAVQSGSDDSTFLPAFRRARTVNAFLFALRRDPFEAVTESCYEAHAATEDLDELVRVVTAVLNSNVT